MTKTKWLHHGTIQWPRGIVYKLALHELYTVVFLEQLDFNSLDTCEDKWYHKGDAKTNAKSMILPRVIWFFHRLFIYLFSDNPCDKR